MVLMSMNNFCCLSKVPVLTYRVCRWSVSTYLHGTFTHSDNHSTTPSLHLVILILLKASSRFNIVEIVLLPDPATVKKTFGTRCYASSPECRQTRHTRTSQRSGIPRLLPYSSLSDHYLTYRMHQLLFLSLLNLGIGSK